MRRRLLQLEVALVVALARSAGHHKGAGSHERSSDSSKPPRFNVRNAAPHRGAGPHERSAPSKPPQINARSADPHKGADSHERSSDPSNPPKINAWNAGKDKQAYGNVPAATSTWDVGGRDDSCHPVPANWSVESIEDSYTAGGFITHGAKLLGKAVGTERSANRERVDARRGGDSRCGRSLNLLFDFGAAKFSSSVGQLMHVYQPEMHFDHVFAWEANEGVFVVPRELGEEGRCERLSDDGPVVSYFNAIVSDHAQPDECLEAQAATGRRALPSMTRLERREAICAWANKTRPACKHFDAAATLAALATREDFVVVKIDIEFSEFPVLDRLEQSGAWPLVDELWVEFHPPHKWLRTLKEEIAKAQTLPASQTQLGPDGATRLPSGFDVRYRGHSGLRYYLHWRDPARVLAMHVWP